MDGIRSNSLDTIQHLGDEVGLEGERVLKNKDIEWEQNEVENSKRIKRRMLFGDLAYNVGSSRNSP